MLIKHRNIITLLLSLCPLFIFVCLRLNSQDGNDGRKILEEIGRENITREEAEAKGDALFNEGRKSFEAGEYKKAVDLYSNARKYLQQGSTTSSHVKTKIEACNEAVSKVYYFWTREVIIKAEESMNAQDYDSAISYCEEAKKIYPQSKDKMNEMIAECQRMKKITAYRKTVSPDTVDPEKKPRLYSIDVLLKQGQTLQKDGELDKARDKFEEVLVQDPYNMQAIESLRIINLQIMKKGKKRTASTRSERMAEAEWKMVTPVVPRTLGG